MREAQRIAASAVCRVLAGRSLDDALAELWVERPRLNPRSRAASQDLAYGTLRHYGLLATVLGQLRPHPPRNPLVDCVMLAALYQLEYTRGAAHAVVSEAVEAALLLDARAPKALVNGVLRNFQRRREALLEAARRTETGRWSHPEWWIARLRRQYPQDFGSILEAGNGRPPMTLRVNLRRIETGAYLARLADQGLAAERLDECALRLEKPVPVERLPGFAEGLVSVQDLGAQHAARLLDVGDGMRVLDACAAPGGKTAHLLELADLDCLALDADPRRLLRVQENLGRLGLAARCVAGDAARPESWWDGRPFDRILVDAPCSASGIVRRHPDIKWLRRESDLAQYAAAQRRLLDPLWQLLGSGGKLLYATCSVFAEENGEQVAQFLERHPDAQTAPLAGLPPDGQLLPGPRHDGFFYALFCKR